MRTRLVFSFVMLFALCAIAALAADVSGVWKASVPGRGGDPMEVTMTFKVEGAKLTGTMTNPMGESQIEEGKVEGNKITFKIKREFGGQTRIMLYEGTVSGNEIQFKQSVEGSERPPREFTAKRANVS